MDAFSFGLKIIDLVSISSQFVDAHSMPSAPDDGQIKELFGDVDRAYIAFCENDRVFVNG